MSKLVLLAGQTRTIYQDPFTKKNPEGDAKLVRRCVTDVRDGQDGAEVWAVMFDDASYPGDTFRRVIVN